jgi:hypothetical protein
VSFLEVITTFATQGTSLTLKQTYDTTGKFVSEDIETTPITDFRDILKTLREGYRKDEWDVEKEMWVESSEQPVAFNWSGDGFVELEQTRR